MGLWGRLIRLEPSGSRKNLMNRRSAFTLIELLVVIAIIAILAAILFPVFAQAKSAAKKTTDLSNQKQISLGIVMYGGDADDTYVTHAITLRGTSIITPAGATLANPQVWWPEAVQPYVKNWQLFRSPGAKQSHPSWSAGRTTGGWYYNWARWTEFGLNVEYLNPAPGDCSAWGGTIEAGLLAFGRPISMTSIANPSATVALTTSKVVGDAAGYFISARVGAPASVTAPEVCTFSNWGWGLGSAGDSVGLYPGNPTSTGYFADYYGGGSNVGMTDGSAKFFQAGNLAAGTNWRRGIANNAVVINDRSRYIWDTQE